MKKKISLIMMAALVTISISSIKIQANEVSYDTDYLKNPYYMYLSEVTDITIDNLMEIEKQSGNLEEYFNIQVPETIQGNNGYKKAAKLSTNSLKPDSYYDTLSAYTGYSKDELIKMEQLEGDLGIYLGLKIDLSKLNSNQVNENRTVEDINITSDSSSGSNNDPMTSTQWDYMKGKADKGDILVTKDQWFLFVNHGHAAIVYEDSAKTVEHTGEGESAVYDISRWASRYTMRDYYPTGTTSTLREAAADYASTDLTGWEYKALPSVTNKTKLNCATLVWKAYDSQGVTLQKTGAGGCTPICFVEGEPNTNYWAGVNWSGENHDW